MDITIIFLLLFQYSINFEIDGSMSFKCFVTLFLHKYYIRMCDAYFSREILIFYSRIKWKILYLSLLFISLENLVGISTMRNFFYVFPKSRIYIPKASEIYCIAK